MAVRCRGRGRVWHRHEVSWRGAARSGAGGGRDVPSAGAGGKAGRLGSRAAGRRPRGGGGRRLPADDAGDGVRALQLLRAIPLDRPTVPARPRRPRCQQRRAALLDGIRVFFTRVFLPGAGFCDRLVHHDVGRWLCLVPRRSSDGGAPDRVSHCLPALLLPQVQRRHRAQLPAHRAVPGGTCGPRLRRVGRADEPSVGVALLWRRRWSRC